MASSDVDLPGRRLPRAERREQILFSATQAFARTGFAATGLDEVAAAAGISRAILYRHFDSKTDLYRAVLDRARQYLGDAVGKPPYSEQIIDDLVAAAARDPAGFRLLFHHAGREPQFRADTDLFGAEMVASAYDHLADAIPDPGWAQWAAHLAPTATIAAITAWLDAGQPDAATAAARIRRVIRGINDAAGNAAPDVPASR
ncbi:MAG: TetR/AcrR family transcriptional regulator [Nocardioidaceae bacterium]